MRVAITDACIFIDLYELDLTAGFFSLSLEIHTSLDIFNELYPHQQQLLKAYQSVNKLFIHNLSMNDRQHIANDSYSKSLSFNDKTVLYLAEQLNAMVISSDKAVRNCAKNRTIEIHGMLWIFDRLVEAGTLGPADASAKLWHLIMTNSIYQNNAQLIGELHKRLKQWA